MYQHNQVDTPMVEDWFNFLYGKARGYLHVASTGNWAGRTFDLDGDERAIDSAIEYVQKVDASRAVPGIYSRVTTLTRRPEEGRRGGADLTCSVPALWADVDIAGPGHRHVECAGGTECPHEQRHLARALPLPPDVDSGLSLIEDSILPRPSLWVHSGGGLYPIWLLDPPVHPDGFTAAIDVVGNLAAEWQHIIMALAEDRGWDYGSGVGDLARVLRIPGTWNRKPGMIDPVMCTVFSKNYLTYDINDLLLARDQAFGEDLPRLGPAVSNSDGPPASSRATWDRPTGDVRPGDDFTARVDWSDRLLLGGLGWRCIAQSGRYREWLRPNAAGALTATTGRGDLDNLWVFSTEAAPFPTQRPISKLEAFRLIHGHATHRDAVKALNAMGFGSAPLARPARSAPVESYEEVPDDE